MQTETSFNCSLLQKIGHRMFKYLALIYRKTFKKKCVDVRGAIDNRWLIIIQIHLLSIFQAYTNELFPKPCLSFPLFVGLDKTTGDVFFYCLLFWSNFFHIYVKGFQISLFYLLAIFVFYIIIFTRIECLACLSCFSWTFFFQVKFDRPTVWPWS